MTDYTRHEPLPAPAFRGPHGQTLAPAPVVSTRHAPVQGMWIDDVAVYRGIRYAAPPVGERRFMPPVDPEPTELVQEALGFGPPAIQGIEATLTTPANDFLMSQMIEPSPLSKSKLENEDCLYLNVWTPGTEGRRPVLVWIHGGGFAFGASSDAWYDGANIALRGDIVVVTLNHRLNIFGFLSLAQFDEQFADAANVGLQDIVHALKWVRENIAAFGGDPDSVTIGGQSGGAGKVSHLMGMPSARGLFHRAIIQSGPGITAVERDESERNTALILRAAGMPERFDRNWLQSVPAATLRDRAISALRSTDPQRSVRYKTIRQMGADLAASLRSTVDGVVLPAHPFEPEASALVDDVPLLIGWVKDEWTNMLVGADPAFVDAPAEEVEAGVAGMFDGHGPELYERARELFPHYAPGHLASMLSGTDISYRTTVLADRKAAQSAPVYQYELAWETPVGGGIYRTPHCLDLPLVLDNVEQSRALVGPGEEPQRMADLMSDAWVAFIRTGTPQTTALPQWPAYDSTERPTMVFDLDPKVSPDPSGPLHEIFRREDL